MILKKIEIQGFKSFADKISLELNQGITAVVGPNGSGKSNISDAVRWVLGEQSMKTLRGNKMEDVIFAGTETRKSLGFAEVSITLENTNAQLPIDYSEVTVTRRVYRSGESEFFINKKACRLKDINELFMGTGLGRDGYSVIGQGKIDEILSSKAEDRRIIFEEAAGIMKYKSRKIEAERKIEQTSQNLLRVNDIIGELESQLEPLKEQSEIAKKFLSLKERLKILEVNVFIINMEKFKEKLDEIQINVENLEAQIQSEQKSFDENQNERKAMHSESERIEHEIEELQQKIFEIEKAIELSASDVKLAQERIDNIEKNDERIKEETETLKQKAVQLEEEKNIKQKKIERLDKDKVRFSDELTIKEAELSKVNQSIIDEQEKIEAMKTEVIERINLISQKKSELNSLKVFLEGISRRESQIEEDMYEHVMSLDMQTMKREDINDEIERLHREIKEIEASISEINILKTGKESEIFGIEKELDSVKIEINSKKSRHKFLSDLERENEGYFKSVKGILEECRIDELFRKGIHGALAQLINVPKEYETSIEIALGSALQNIVTADEDSAKKAIDFLKQRNLGRATFLPLNVVKGSSLDEAALQLKSSSGYKGVASKLVQCAKEYKGIVDNLLGHTIVVDNMDNGIAMARKHKYSFRIITIDGDIINSSGAMSGGSINTRTAGLLSRSREIKEISDVLIKLEQKLNERMKTHEELKASITKYIEDINLKNIDIKERQVASAREEEKLTALENLVKSINDKTIILKAEKEQIKIQKSDAESSMEIKRNEIADMDKLTEQLQSSVKEAQESFKLVYVEKDRVFEHISNIRVSLSSIEESISGVQEDMQRISSEIESLDKDITKKHSEKERKHTEKSTLEEAIEKYKIKAIEFEAAKVEMETKLSQAKKTKEDMTAKLTNLEDFVIEKLKVIENLKEESSRFEIKKTKIEMDLEALQNRMWEEYEITLGNSLEYKRDISGVGSAQKEITQLKNEIKDLGIVNVSSIEEYTKTKERYEFLTHQRDDLLDAEEKLKRVISEMTSIMKRQFIEQFYRICENFNEVFKELFGGGKASLKLADEENILESGIDIEVQPPGKKLQNMMLLSGGEKALTAIALLFAILRINPAPFCILDEIEAALDEANVYIFADYLKNFTFNTQFILITHRKGTMESANTMYGVTMEERGVSKLVSLKMNDKAS
ncbi:MAG: chromosome segregation protein SMC [Deltaproteobacteria bacterium]